MSISIVEERPDTVDAIMLIDALEATLAPYYPPESRHGYSVEKLIREGVAFFVARYDGAAAACGGVQFYGTDYGEVKRMYVKPEFRGLGLARRILDHLAAYTQQHGITILRLETGIHQEAAIGLYESAGFQRIPPFGDYKDDPLSVFFEKALPG
ncbi:MAG: GNAT family N-acetyltransferase [Anaerolineae bacterium]